MDYSHRCQATLTDIILEKIKRAESLSAEILNVVDKDDDFTTKKNLEDFH